MRSLGPGGAVFLDRDGTINVKAPEGEYITAPDQLTLLPGAAHAISRLNHAGALVIVVTNQRGIALGRMTEDRLADVHARLRLILQETAGARLDAIFHCPHDADQCLCRKPAPGLIYQARTWRPEIDLTQSIMIGDSRTDSAAGERAGLSTILLGEDAGDLVTAVDGVLSTTLLAAQARSAPERGLTLSYRDTHATAPRALMGACCLLAGSIVVTFALMLSASGAGASQTCTPEAAIRTSSPFYDIENSDSPGGSTCLTVSPTGVSFRVDSSSYDTSVGVPADQQFTGYMAAFTGCKHGGCLEPNYPAQASRIRSEVSNWSFNFSATGRFDAVYDAYFNTTPTEQRVPTGAELMIWLNEQNVSLMGPQLPDVTIGGTKWHVFDVYKQTPVGNWNRIAFERATPVTSVSSLDLAPFIQAAISDGAIAPGWYQQDLEAGFEIWTGGVGLTTYSFSANPPILTPLSASGSGGTGSGGTGSGGTGSGGAGSGGTSGSGGAGPRTTGSTRKSASRPTVSLALPECSTTISRRKCAALRRTAGAWRHVVGMAADDTAATRVNVTAVRAAQKHAKRKTVKVRAKFMSRTAWRATIPGLTQGRWRFTATATDTAGLTRTTKPITVSINVGLPAS